MMENIARMIEFDVHDQVTNMRVGGKILSANVRLSARDNPVDLTQHTWNVAVNIYKARSQRFNWHRDLRKIHRTQRSTSL